jgi:hypothetical protein
VAQQQYHNQVFLLIPLFQETLASATLNIDNASTKRRVLNTSGNP